MTRQEYIGQWNGLLTNYVETLATLPRQAEWEAYVARFQGCAANARSDEKWQRMERIF